MELLNQLKIDAVNPGAFSGQGWMSQHHQHHLISYSPANGEKLAEIATCTMDDYEVVMSRAVESAQDWRLSQRRIGKECQHPNVVKLSDKLVRLYVTIKTVWEVLFR